MGEQVVQEELRRLPQTDWTVANAVELEGTGGDFDHIVVGPSGVWLLNTKYLSSAVSVDRDGVYTSGRWTDFAAREARAASRLSGWLRSVTDLRVFVRPVLVLVGQRPQVIEPNRLVGVIGHDELVDGLMAAPTAELPVEALRRIHGLVRALRRYPMIFG